MIAVKCLDAVANPYLGLREVLEGLEIGGADRIGSMIASDNARRVYALAD